MVMDTWADLDPAAALALLAWQVELGADEPMLDAPVDRLGVADPPPAAVPAPPPPPPPPLTLTLTAPGPAPAPSCGSADHATLLAQARALAAGAADLPALAAALAGWDGFAIRQGARSLVFADGRPGARIMILGEAPGDEEDRQGKPFVGRAGQLLDRMLAAIGLDRAADDPARAVYIANVLSWRPPGNRDPSPEEIALALPFVARHVALADPALVVLMGNTACAAALGRRGILRLRGQWAEAFGRPALPMTHPAYLLRNPVAKREAWADLLALADRAGLPPA